MNLAALREKLTALDDAQRAAVLREELDAGRVQKSDATAIATELKFPGWEAFDARRLAQVGTRPHGGSDQNTIADRRTLPRTSPLFARAAFGAIDAAPPQGASAKADAITGLLADDDHEKQILALVKSCAPDELNDVLSRIDCERLFAVVHDHKLFGFIPEGRNYGTELARFVTSDQNLPALSVAVRTALVDGMQKTDTGDVEDAQQAAIAKIFVATGGRDLTALKNAIDLGDDQNNMHNLIYRSINHRDLRAQILDHIRVEAAQLGNLGQVKGLFDVDDTFYANLIDTSYPHGTVYPGTTAWHRELDLGPGGGDRLGDNSLLSARPHDKLGLSEKATLKTVHDKGEGPIAVITGDIFHFIGNEEIAEKKISNYNEFAPIYPEYKKVFEGDSGQGDVLVAIELMSKHKDDMAAAFVHELPNHRTDPALRARAEALGVVFYDTRVGQALAGYQKGLISAAGLGRIMDAAQADFARVDFGGDHAKRNARKAELDRDCAAARQALGIA